ncbi:MAG: hypothetical protein M1829_002414 [Trizodia sp. TS-e1964]|nr:MAG: hypothetical protein M1829_002414 [Trizodia sp. TS-e1964]
MIHSQEDEELQLLTERPDSVELRRESPNSITSASTTSLVLDQLNCSSGLNGFKPPPRIDSLPEIGQYYDKDPEEAEDDEYTRTTPRSRIFRKFLLITGILLLGAWLLAFVIYASRKALNSSLAAPILPTASQSSVTKKAITLDQVMQGAWYPRKKSISWIEGTNGEDGLLLEVGQFGKDYLVVEDVRGRKESASELTSITLMKSGRFMAGGQWITAAGQWPSPDLKNVLVLSEKKSNWRHSFYGRYWILDVATQNAQPLDLANPDGRIQLASWSPQSDAIVFTRDNNMFLRKLSSNTVIPITRDGGTELFHGVPDWVYEEEVFAGNSATWWARDGKFIAFLRTNESVVPEYPVQYFISRPSGKQPAPGEENYPEVRQIKYPKAGAPNPVVDLQFYDVQRNEVFSVEIGGDFPDEDRLITEVVWAGDSGEVLVRETNRESDILQVALIDVTKRTGYIVRSTDVNALDGGWFEVSEETRFIPADPNNHRPNDGYIDTIIHEGYNHLAYFTPMDNPNPILLTAGPWEVVQAPSAVDLKNNLVYFVSTKEAPIQRHVYSVKLDGSNLQPVTNTTTEGYYDVSFSKGAGFALLSYNGPEIPWQRVTSTSSNQQKFEEIIENNAALTDLASKYELPTLIYQTVAIDGFLLQVVERRPPHFNPRMRYPVLFHLYGGPGSQTVDKKFSVNFQSFVAANLGYIVVTVDGRGTGFIGRKARCIIRGNIGYYESRDQIETAKIWAKKAYVDSSKMAIWGWSYGGFMTLKTLEQDAGQTFKYGMAVAPVTDWRFYDSIYTERYMHTPQHNLGGYENATISNMTALQQNVRFLIMHGVADDNVHMQNSLTLLDKLDLAGVENYDVHVFPDSDHSIYFHNANRIVYDKLKGWLINAFNGEWLRIEDPKPEKINIASRFKG